jgi:RNA polymerase sigma-70 factor (ECF subfamily)
VAPSDEALLESWREGDRAAGEALLRRHFDAPYSFFRGKLDDRTVVEDLVQRTMLATFAGARDSAATRPFAPRTVVNTMRGCSSKRCVASRSTCRSRSS